MVTTKDAVASEWMTKEQVAAYLQISKRQVELAVEAGNLPSPSYLGKQTPRWNRTDIDTALKNQKRGGK
jgi:excisionase family DNA binding protein